MRQGRGGGAEVRSYHLDGGEGLRHCLSRIPVFFHGWGKAAASATTVFLFSCTPALFNRRAPNGNSPKSLKEPQNTQKDRKKSREAKPEVHFEVPEVIKTGLPRVRLVLKS